MYRCPSEKIFFRFRCLVTEAHRQSTTNILSGKPIAERLLSQCENECREFREKYHRRPQLVAILVGGNESSKLYVRNKQRVAERVGSFLRRIGFSYRFIFRSFLSFSLQESIFM